MMKTSKYNIISKMSDGKTVAFNGLTCSFAKVEDDFLNVLNNASGIKYEELDGEEKKLVDSMMEGGFIFSNDVDEDKLLKFQNMQNKFNSDVFAMTIAPTMKCNFACPYCFETQGNSSMNEDVKNALYQSVEAASLQGMHINVNWFGGEPLLEINTIHEISRKFIKICDEHKVKYRATIITNGYLINEETCQMFKEINIEAVQITLDGPPDTHDKRRVLKNNKPTFYKIIENIKLLQKNELQVAIRVNVDESNFHETEKLLDILEGEGIKKNIDFGLGHVMDYNDSGHKGSCLSCKEFANTDFIFEKLLRKRGFKDNNSLYFPMPRPGFCGADSLYTFVVDPEGYLYKCWCEIGIKKNSCGSITNSGSDNMVTLNRNKMNLANWMLSSPQEFVECKDCTVLPYCMGGCPYVMKISGKPQCVKWKFNFQELLEFNYLILNGDNTSDGEYHNDTVS